MKIISLFFSLIVATSFSATAFSEEATQKAILVTGASSGIGLRITEVLSENGYFVYAGARKKADLERLNAMKNVASVRLDVTVQEEIDAAVEFVSKQGRGLYGLVNNAGVAVVGPLIELDVKEVEWQFDVNVLGPYRITQAFAPFIIESKGRITTTGSISGILSQALMGPYSMSKHAIEAYTDSLAAEMARFDVRVSVVEPGSYASRIMQSTMKRFSENPSMASDNSAYEQDIEALTSRKFDPSVGKDPKEVAQAVLHAMSSENPKRRYMVTPNADQARYTIGGAMRELIQLNMDQPYELSRDQLIEMMDQMLPKDM
jgi:NAD(P)-dependent dehydrogenase (short-subunit alcohol dehydrogenase family)